jgi:hypothetical protein
MQSKAQDSYRTVSSDYIYSQGAMANHTGSLNETTINEALETMGLSPKKVKYESLYSTRATMDLSLKELGIAGELRYQQVAGSADEKGGTSLFNAGQSIECEDFVVVFSGPHWDTARGQKLVEMYKAMAAKFNKHPDDFCVAAKRLHVMRECEFIRFIDQRRKERL